MPVNPPLLLQACKLSLLLLLLPFLLPLLFFTSIIIFFSSFVIIPLLCISLSSYLLYRLVNQFSIQSLLKIPINLCVKILDTSSPSPSSPPLSSPTAKTPPPINEENKICQEDHAVSLEFDPLEFSSVEESEEEEISKRDEGTSIDSWHMQFLKSFRHVEDKPFYQTLNYWKKKEEAKT